MERVSRNPVLDCTVGYFVGNMARTAARSFAGRAGTCKEGIEIMARHRFAVRAILGSLVAAPPAMAQVSLASVTGVVADSAEAVIPGASVVIRNVETGIETAVESNESGYYTLISLVPGTYELEVSSDGFRRFVRGGLELETGQNLRPTRSRSSRPLSLSISSAGRSRATSSSTRRSRTCRWRAGTSRNLPSLSRA